MSDAQWSLLEEIINIHRNKKVPLIIANSLTLIRLVNSGLVSPIRVGVTEYDEYVSGYVPTDLGITKYYEHIQQRIDCDIRHTLTSSQWRRLDNIIDGFDSNMPVKYKLCKAINHMIFRGYIIPVNKQKCDHWEPTVKGRLALDLYKRFREERKNRILGTNKARQDKGKTIS